jgi:hypothetical protein
MRANSARFKLAKPIIEGIAILKNQTKVLAITNTMD